MCCADLPLVPLVLYLFEDRSTFFFIKGTAEKLGLPFCVYKMGIDMVTLYSSKYKKSITSETFLGVDCGSLFAAACFFRPLVKQM